MPKSGNNSPEDGLNPYAPPEGASLAENPPVFIHPAHGVRRNFFVWMFVSFPAAFVAGLITIIGGNAIDPILEMRRNELVCMFAVLVTISLAIWGIFQMRSVPPWPAIPQMCFAGIMIWWLFGAGVYLVHHGNIDYLLGWSVMCTLCGIVNSVIGIFIYFVLHIHKPRTPPQQSN